MKKKKEKQRSKLQELLSLLAIQSRASELSGILVGKALSTVILSRKNRNRAG